MNNLTLSGFFDPLPHGIWVVALWNILPSHRRFRKYPCPSYSRESEGPCSSAGVQGAGPLASAERAASPSAEGWREVRREEGNASQCMVPFLSPRIRKLQRRPQHAAREEEFVH